MKIFIYGCLYGIGLIILSVSASFGLDYLFKCMHNHPLVSSLLICIIWILFCGFAATKIFKLKVKYG